MQKRWNIIICQKLLMLSIIVSFRQIVWPWSHILKQQQKRFNYVEEINIKTDSKKMKNIIIYQKLLLLYIILRFRPILWPWSHILKQQQIRFNYIEEINIKSDAKKMKDYNISKIIIVLYYCKFSANSLAMITHIKTTTKKI